MADNVAITAGSGTTIAADDVGAGVLVQRVKATWGPDGTANDADVATGKPLPAQIRSATGLIPIGEPTDAKSTATDTTSASLIAINKQISASVQASATTLTAIDGRVDGLEGLIGTTNSTLTTIDGRVDGLEALIGTTNSTLSTIDGRVDGLETLIGATNTALGTVNSNLTTIDGRVDGLEALIASTNTKLDTLNSSLTAGTVDTGTPGSPNTTEVVSMQGQDNMTPVASVGKTAVFDVTLVLDTGAYAAGDLLFVTQQLNGILRVADGTGVIQAIQIIDQDDNGAAFDLYFLSANVSMGTINAAPSISDANAVNLHGPISVATTDYKDLGGVKVANIRNIGLPVKAVSGTDDLYIAGVNGAGTPTYTASGIKLRISVLLD